MTPPPRLTFVVLSYNYGRYLSECLESILAQQDVGDFEVIIVDDASTDNSESIARSYAALDSRVHVTHHASNKGHAATVTTGLRQAKGTYVARIDCDDRYRPHFAREILDVFERHPEVGLVYGDAALIDESGNVTAERSDREHHGMDSNGNEFVRLLTDNFVCAPTVAARREAWCGALPIPEGLAFHDWYFTLMIARQYDFYYRHAVLADYRVHNMNSHKRIVRERTVEASTFGLLDKIYAESESRPELERQKRDVRRRAYAAQYLTLADKYFGLAMDADARRCYLHALGIQPGYLLHPGVLRRLLATMTSRQAYEWTKSFVKKVDRRPA